MSIFEFNSYRDIIQHEIERSCEKRGYRSRLAKTAGISASYLSQVLHGSMNISPDQAMAMCDFWEYDALHSNYFVHLVDWERSQSARLKAQIGQQLSYLRLRASFYVAQDDKVRLSGISNDQAYILSSEWYFGAIWEILRVTDKDNVSVIAETLGLSEALVSSVLEKLREMDLVICDKGVWSVIGDSEIQVLEGNLRVGMYHKSVRDRANQRVMEGPKIFDRHNTVVFAMNAEDLPKLREKINDCVREALVLSRNDKRKDRLSFLAMDLFSF